MPTDQNGKKWGNQWMNDGPSLVERLPKSPHAERNLALAKTILTGQSTTPEPDNEPTLEEETPQDPADAGEYELRVDDDVLEFTQDDVDGLGDSDQLQMAISSIGSDWKRGIGLPQFLKLPILGESDIEIEYDLDEAGWARGKMDWRPDGWSDDMMAHTIEMPDGGSMTGFAMYPDHASTQGSGAMSFSKRIALAKKQIQENPLEALVKIRVCQDGPRYVFEMPIEVPGLYPIIDPQVAGKTGDTLSAADHLTHASIPAGGLDTSDPENFAQMVKTQTDTWHKQGLSGYEIESRIHSIRLGGFLSSEQAGYALGEATSGLSNPE